jgi:hypothetical protein
MPALTDLSDIINRITSGNDGTPEHLFFWKDARVGAAAAPAIVAGRMASLWQYNGVPAGGAVPGAASVPTNATVGALMQANPGGAREKWLLGMVASSLNVGTLILYDRLLHHGGLDGTVTADQTVGAEGMLTRNAGGFGNQIWLEIYTAIGTTPTTITARYTNELGVAGQTSIATVIGGTNFREATRIIPLPLADGDRGVRGVWRVRLAGTTGAAGNFGVTIARPLAFMPISLVGAGSVRDFISGLPSVIKIDTDACLAFAWLPNTTVVPQIFGSLHFVEK